MSLPLFYYPTIVIWLTDNPKNTSLANEMCDADFNIKNFNCPTQLLKFFASYIPHSEHRPFVKVSEASEDYDFSFKHPVEINIQSLLSILHSTKKKEEISVVISDYKISGTTGIEALREIKNKNVKKILIAGEDYLEQAIAAFNEGIIDFFINETTKNLKDLLHKQIIKFSWKYFADLSKVLLCYLEANRNLHFSDISFEKFFRDWFIDNEIKEYCISDKFGNIQAIDAEDKKINFILHTEKTLNDFIEIYEDKESALYIKKIKTKEKIPYFHGKEPWELKRPEWSSCLFSPKEFIGRERYFWLDIKN